MSMSERASERACVLASVVRSRPGRNSAMVCFSHFSVDLPNHDARTRTTPPRDAHSRTRDASRQVAILASTQNPTQNLSLSALPDPHPLIHIITPTRIDFRSQSCTLLPCASAGPSHQFCLPVSGSNFGIGFPVFTSNLAPEPEVAGGPIGRMRPSAMTGTAWGTEDV